MHYSHLYEVPFNLIKDGIKHYEYRLNDNKRKKYKISDTIRFYLFGNESEYIDVKIIGLKKYKNLYDMYSDTVDDHLSKYYSNVEDAVDDTNYFSDKNIKKYGCLSIEIELLSKKND